MVSSFMIDIYTCQICHTLQAAMFDISKEGDMKFVVQIPLLFPILMSGSNFEEFRLRECYGHQ